MKQHTLHFQPQLIPTIFIIFVVPIFIGLGIWQLDRADQKRAVTHTLEQRRNLPPLQLSTSNINFQQAEFRTLSGEGTFLQDKSILIENRKYRGKTGFHIITPLQIKKTNHYVLVNRGWIPSQYGTSLPTFPTPQGDISVVGDAYIPKPPAIKLGLDKTTNRWPFITLKDYTEWSGLRIYPFIILQAQDNTHGFVRNWPKQIAKDGMHTGYAIQWFAFAIIALAIWLKISTQKQKAA